MNAPRTVSAKEARQLTILAEEHAIAAGAYANRRPRDDARTLRMTAVQSRLPSSTPGSGSARTPDPLSRLSG